MSEIMEKLKKISFFDVLRVLFILFLAVMLAWIVLPILLIRFIFLTLWRYFRVIFSRLSFCRKLKRICRKKGLRYKACRPRLLSIFLKYSGNDIRIEGENGNYAIKFFPRNPIGYSLNFDCEKETGELKYFVTPSVTDRLAGVVALLCRKNQPHAPKKAFDGRKMAKMKFGGAEDTKILAVQPTPLHMIHAVGNVTKPLYSGECVGDVAVYEAGALLSYVERTIL